MIWRQIERRNTLAIPRTPALHPLLQTVENWDVHRTLLLRVHLAM
jgi:hypothetical protein